jgi:hypothetical protein
LIMIVSCLTLSPDPSVGTGPAAGGDTHQAESASNVPIDCPIYFARFGTVDG